MPAMQLVLIEPSVEGPAQLAHDSGYKMLVEMQCCELKAFDCIAVDMGQD